MFTWERNWFQIERYPIIFYPGSFLFKMHSKCIIDLSVLLMLIPQVYCNFDPLLVGLRVRCKLVFLMFLAIPDTFQSFFVPETITPCLTLKQSC